LWEDVQLSGEARYIALGLVACRAPFLMSECTDECGEIVPFIFRESARGEELVFRSDFPSPCAA